MHPPYHTPWWVRFQREPIPNSIRWFLFHHAGGSASSFAPWLSFIPKGAEVYCLELPGRGRRMQEAFITDWNNLLKSLTQSIHPLLTRPYIFFGHSLGAVISFKLCQILQSLSLPKPRHLFLSGRRAPMQGSKSTQPDLSREGLLDYLRLQNGTPKEIFEDKSLIELILPRFKADLILNSHYNPDFQNRITTPITVYAGKDDQWKKEDYLAWQDQTSADFQLKFFHGGHFFLNDHINKIIVDMQDQYHSTV